MTIQAAKFVGPINWKGVPESFKGKLSAVCRTALECEELVRWFGSPDFCPLLPVMVMVPGAQTPTLIPGFGYATAAELRDCAVTVWHQQIEKLAKDGRLFDYDELRERRGLMRREDVDSATRQAMLDRIERHRRNPVTDPPRQPVRHKPTGRVVFERK